jgi:anti-anti-sigma factor
MTVTTFHYGNPVHDCGPAQMRARCRQLATVVTISGEIDDSNTDLIAEYVRHNILAEKPFILDLSGVNYVSAHSISLFDTVAELCDAVAVEWRLIASPPVARALDSYGDQAGALTAESVPDALEEFAELSRSRRRLLPLLTKTA